MSIQVESVQGFNLYHQDDLPYDPWQELPFKSFYYFKCKRSRNLNVRKLLPSPKVGELPFVKEPC